MSLLEVSNLSMAIPGVQNLILDDISFSLAAGENLMIIGSNGAGKSSLLSCLAGSNVHYSGSINLAGNCLRTYKSKDLRSMIRILGQNTSAYVFAELTVRENMTLAAKFLSQDMHAVNVNAYLETIRPGLSEHLDKVVGMLSGGERQAVALAMILLQPPQILILDEHLSAVDKKNGEHIDAVTKKLAKELGFACIQVTHDMGAVLKAQGRVLVMSKGRIHSQAGSGQNVLLASLP